MLKRSTAEPVHPLGRSDPVAAQRGPVLADTPAALEADLLDLEAIEGDLEFDSRWRELDSLYPGNTAIFATRVRRLLKDKLFDEVVELIDSHVFAADEAVTRAKLLFDARATERAIALFDEILASDPASLDARTGYAKRLLSNGLLARAHHVVAPLNDCPEGSKSRELVDRVNRLHELLTRLEGRSLSRDEDARILAMKHAILRFSDRPRRQSYAHDLGRLCLITGGLGAGGAERQLTRLAVELEKARISTGEISGIRLSHPVEVLVRSYDPDLGKDFYLDELQSAGVVLHQINEFRPVHPKNQGIDDPEMLALLNYLPSSVNYGVKRLVDYFRDSSMETVSVWQDGACLFAGLAALIAGVPHIQLAIRGLPPSMRHHMFRPEYEAFYRAMAQVPGVSFISNNVTAGQAYADWLDIPFDRFAIVYNGVEPMRIDPSPSCKSRWNAFVKATSDAEHTIGSVFRFNTDKQPLLWIRFAARYLKQHPKTRIVMVGGGRLLPNAERLAEELGISQRILFVGSSNRVGNWMSKMDALVLLSRYEGLPNVLIEAQYMGVPVVTTPAGGAAECLNDGVTGHVLDSAEKPDPERLIEAVRDLACRSDSSDMFEVGGVGRTFLDAHFSIPHMLAQYVTCTRDMLRSLDAADAGAESREAA
jgi:glycosyltransferase involved in cell wall biosynthesis